MGSSDWHEQAACGGTADPIFFPSSGRSENGCANEAAQLYCNACPVYVQCLDSAMTNKDVGVWAGTSTDLRKKLLRKRNRKKCPGCENDRISFQENNAVCLSCGLSWTLENIDDDQ
jgi:hypothetical protein